MILSSFCYAPLLFPSVTLFPFFFIFLRFFLRRAFRLQKGSGFSLKFLFWFFFSFSFFFCCFSLSGPRGILPGPSGPGGVHESLQKTKENGTPSAAHVLITKSRDLSGKPRAALVSKNKWQTKRDSAPLICYIDVFLFVPLQATALSYAYPTEIV